MNKFKLSVASYALAFVAAGFACASAKSALFRPAIAILTPSLCTSERSIR